MVEYLLKLLRDRSPLGAPSLVESQPGDAADDDELDASADGWRMDATIRIP
jgi:hypothetical protein